MIASKAEIKALAFNATFDINAIKDNLIQLVEWEQVMTLLGTDLYDDVVDYPANYTTLIGTYLKPFIAYNVKAYISSSNHLKTGNKGAQIARGSNEEVGDVESAKREAMAMATSYQKQIVTYLNELKPLLWNGESDSKGIINKIIIL